MRIYELALIATSSSCFGASSSSMFGRFGLFTNEMNDQIIGGLIGIILPGYFDLLLCSCPESLFLEYFQMNHNPVLSLFGGTNLGVH